MRSLIIQMRPVSSYNTSRVIPLYVDEEMDYKEIERLLRGLVKSVELTCLLAGRGEPASTSDFLKKQDEDKDHFKKLLEKPVVAGYTGTWLYEIIDDNNKVLFKEEVRATSSLIAGYAVLRNFNTEDHATKILGHFFTSSVWIEKD